MNLRESLGSAKTLLRSTDQVVFVIVYWIQIDEIKMDELNQAMAAQSSKLTH